MDKRDKRALAALVLVTLATAGAYQVTRVPPPYDPGVPPAAERKEHVYPPVDVFFGGPAPNAGGPRADPPLSDEEYERLEAEQEEEED